jgi:hypothetical protein
MKVGVWQSNYIPWKGYFDYINSVDVFCLYDEVQYTKNDWRNRNQLLNSNGLFWVTIPIDSKFTQHKISEVTINNSKVLNKHLKSIQQCYAKAPQKEEVLDLLSPIYSKEWTHLSPLNHTLIKAICKYIGITTKIVNSKNYELKPTRLDRLIHLNTQLGATTYLSGLNAKNYIDGNEPLFNKKNIQLEWKTYGSYLKYQRITPLYSDKVSIIDLLMHIPKNQLLNYITSNG